MPNGRESERNSAGALDQRTKYLTVTGLLYPDNRLDLQPGFTTDNAEYAGEDRESEVAVEFLNDDGTPLLRQGVPCGPICADGAHVDYWLVAAKVPFPPESRVMRFFRRGIFIRELRIPEQPPSVRVDWEPGREKTGEQVFRWRSEHPAGARLQYIVSYSGDAGKSWRPISPPIADSEFVVDFGQLPGGDRCMLAVTATDGFNTVTIATEPFAVPTKPCLAMILAPENGSVLRSSEPVRLQGQGFWLEENRPELEALDWRSSQDGSLGRGAILQLTGMSPGAHKITLLAGTESRIGESFIEIQVTGE